MDNKEENHRIQWVDDLGWIHTRAPMLLKMTFSSFLYSWNTASSSLCANGSNSTCKIITSYNRVQTQQSTLLTIEEFNSKIKSMYNINIKVSDISLTIHYDKTIILCR